ncbi:MAG: MarR family transcriptional regulator [Candidatus Hermodarchaeota archaeon]
MQDKDQMCFLKCINLLFKLPWKILSYLKANKNRKKPIDSKDIQKVFHIKGSTVSIHLKSLEQLGLIKRPKNGRNKEIQITELGELFIPD